MEPLTRKALLAGGIVFAAMIVAVVLPALLTEKPWVIVLAPCEFEELLVYRGEPPAKLVIDADEARIAVYGGKGFSVVVEGCRGCARASKTSEPNGTLRVRVENKCKGPQVGAPRVEVTVPASSTTALSVELGVGSLEASNAQLSSLAVDVGVGRVELDTVAVVENLSASMGTGDFEAKSLRVNLSTRIDVDIGVGRALLSLDSTSAVVEAGSELGGVRVSGCTTGQGPMVSVDIDIGDAVVLCEG